MSSYPPISEDEPVIHGLKILISGGELEQHLRTKVDYHTEKAVGYSEQLTSIEELQRGDANNYQSNDPRQGLANSAAIHRNKAALFTFMADHLITGANYMLDESDLLRVEIMERGW